MKITDQKFTLNLDELKCFEFPLDEFFDLQLNYGDTKYEFLVRFSGKNKNLICMGSGAFDPKKISPPIYSRFTWQSEFEESIIYYNDPTLYLDNVPSLRLGWGVGKHDEWYLPVIADIIQILAHKNDVEHENILFFGSSGGGFTSIILSTLIKNSSAMVNNPQLFCLPWKEFFDNIKKACFDNLDTETIIARYGHRFDVVKMFKREKYVPPITYLVNVNSHLDMKQLIPFINSLAPFKNFNYRVKILLYPKENGHNGVLDKEETIILIKNHFKIISRYSQSAFNFKTNPEVENTTLSSVLAATMDSPTANKSVLINNTLPKLKKADPTKNAVNIPTNKLIKLFFDDKINYGTGCIELKDNSGTVIPITTSIRGNVLTITPSNLLAKGITYSIWIHAGSVTDLEGNPVAFYTSFFTTSNGPAITTLDPAKDETKVPTFKLIKLFFDDTINYGTGWIELKDNSGTVIPITTSIRGNVLTITPSNLLARGITYSIWIHAGSVTDLEGNPVAFYTSFFTTINT